MRDIVAELKALRLHGMAQCYAEQTAHGGASVQIAAELFGGLLDAEVVAVGDDGGLALQEGVPLRPLLLDDLEAGDDLGLVLALHGVLLGLELVPTHLELFYLAVQVVDLERGRRI